MLLVLLPKDSSQQEEHALDITNQSINIRSLDLRTLLNTKSSIPPLVSFIYSSSGIFNFEF